MYSVKMVDHFLQCEVKYGQFIICNEVFLVFTIIYVAFVCYSVFLVQHKRVRSCWNAVFFSCEAKTQFLFVAEFYRWINGMSCGRPASNFFHFISWKSVMLYVFKLTDFSSLDTYVGAEWWTCLRLNSSQQRTNKRTKKSFSIWFASFTII